MEKKYNHLEIQKKLQSDWETQGIYTLSGEKPLTLSENFEEIFVSKGGEADKPIFSIDTPPPTVSGSLHIGHIFSYTQTDIIARFKRMSGYNVYYPFGFDDNGLPTERFVEKKRAIAAHQLKRSEFIEICLQETQEVEEKFKELWQQMGLSVDWQQCYSTISPLVRKISQASFIELYKKGFVYRKNEPALFCTACRTSVAQAELDDVVKSTQFITIKFETVAGEPLLIATTRPELLAACQAIFYHPQDSRYQYLKNTFARVPLYNFEVPIIADEAVIPNKGTGLVMCCTFGDKTDIAWFKKYNLEYKQAISQDGRMTAITGVLHTMKVAAARAFIISQLQDANLLIESKNIEHAVNIHERCKQDIEFLMLPQWFLSIMPYKEQIIEMGDNIYWYPHFMKARFKNWVENISWDWCLSRQRFFGIPFPVWHCECGGMVFAKEQDLPIDPQENTSPSACPDCGSTNIKGDTDVMDTWNTSSLTPYICNALMHNLSTNFFEEKKFQSMSMRPQAHDIIRTWAFYTIIKAWMHNKTIPWKDIVISGHVLSTEKEKISKSQSNAPLQPENLLETYSADALRFWTASGSLGQDVPFSDNQLKIGQKLTTKLWNAFIFIKEHGTISDDFNQEPHMQVNRWITSRAQQTYKLYQEQLNNNEFGLALLRVEELFWHDFCDNYLEIIKDYLFNSSSYQQEKVKEIRQTLYIMGLRILQLYAPYLVYVTDALYRELYKSSMIKPSIHVTEYHGIQATYYYQESADAFQAILELVATVRKLKSDHQLSLKTTLAVLTISTSAEKIKFLQAEGELIKGVTKALSLEFKSIDKTELQQVGEHYHAMVIL